MVLSNFPSREVVVSAIILRPEESLLGAVNDFPMIQLGRVEFPLSSRNNVIPT